MHYQHLGLTFGISGIPGIYFCRSFALFGFLSWQLVLALGLNHVYSTWWFLSLLVLFGTSLTVCTFTRQFPALKAAQRWQFYRKSRQFQKLAFKWSQKKENIKQTY